jgi:hypothetical protein
MLSVDLTFPSFGERPRYDEKNSTDGDTINKTALFSVLAAAALTLTGCAPVIPQSDPTSSPTSSPSLATPSPSPTPEAAPAPAPAAEAERLVMSASGVQIFLDDGTVGLEFGYFDPIGPVADDLSGLFGQVPVITTYDGNVAADYDWPGLSIGTDGPATPPMGAEIVMFVTAAEVNGISIETVDGIQVGDPLAPLEAAYPEDSYRWQRDGGEVQGEELVVTIDSVPVSADYPEREFSVELIALPSSGPITRMRAPMKNFE